MRRTLFVSGWAGFEALFPGLGGEFVLPYVDQGEEDIVRAVARFAQSGQSGQSGQANPTEDDLALIGWSSGAHILLKRCREFFPQFAKILLLAPFTCFADHINAGELDDLAKALARSPAAALRGFYRRCGFTGPIPAIPAETVHGLRQGLDYLAHSRADAAELPENVILVHGDADRIVAPRASVDLARAGRASLKIVPGGHYFHPRSIHGFLGEVAPAPGL